MGQFAFGLVAGIVVGLVMEWVIDWSGLLPRRAVRMSDTTQQDVSPVPTTRTAHAPEADASTRPSAQPDTHTSTDVIGE